MFPILGICYGAQLIAQQLGGTVGRGLTGEYGRTQLERSGPSLLLPDDAPPTHDVWMSHFDGVTVAPDGFSVTASSPGAPVAVLENDDRKIYGVQFHPEVVHSPFGMATMARFLHERAGLGSDWTMASVIDEQVEQIRQRVGDARVICGLSGGVDSSVAAALVHKAIGPQLTCIYVDTGLMRKNESEQVVETFRRNLGIELIHADEHDSFFEALAGVTEPEAKRKAIGERFIRVFEKYTGGVSEAKFLVQGTLYPDLIESGGADGTADVIKSHHNVGGLPGRHGPRADRAAARPVQGRGTGARHRAGPARRDGLAAAVPGAGTRGADHRRGHPGTRRPAAGSRCDRPRGAARAGLERTIWQIVRSPARRCALRGRDG